MLLITEPLSVARIFRGRVQLLFVHVHLCVCMYVHACTDCKNFGCNSKPAPNSPKWLHQSLNFTVLFQICTSRYCYWICVVKTYQLRWVKISSICMKRVSQFFFSQNSHLSILSLHYRCAPSASTSRTACALLVWHCIPNGKVASTESSRNTSKPDDYYCLIKRHSFYMHFFSSEAVLSRTMCEGCRRS